MSSIGPIYPPEKLKRDSIRVGYHKAQAGQWIFGLPFIAIGAFLITAMIMEWGKAPKSPALVIYCGALFAATGLLLTINGLRMILWRRRMMSLPPEKPWLGDYRWKPTHANDNGLPGIVRMLTAIGVFITILLPFHWIAFSGRRLDHILLVFLGCFDLVMLLIFFLAASRLYSWIRLGTSRLRYPNFPCFVGAPLEFRFEGNRSMVNRDQLTAQLCCVQERYEIRGESQRRKRLHLVHECIWREEISFSTDAQGRAQLLFTLPPEAPGSDFLADPPRYWEIEVSAISGHKNYRKCFMVPIYK